jgi:menaquinone-9 beta-reductase
MDGDRYDVVVVGSGPAGATAALVLARGGARVALVDKAPFPRDKACGDLVGPRGVALLADLGLAPDGARALRDMVVVGPTGGRVRLPCVAGLGYPGHGFALARLRFDAWLKDQALEAGVHWLSGRVARLRWRRGRDGAAVGGAVDGVELSSGGDVRADMVVGADGATSTVAEAAGLVDARHVLWGFAVRVYLDQPVDVPHIVLWAPEPGRAFPGYGWLFPGADGRANAGLGLGTGADRRAGAEAVRRLPTFFDHLRRAGLIDGSRAGAPRERLGGWLKMGMVGTTPAAGRVLLTGDAAGLVNPLQGEGIAHALTSGRLAAEAVLTGAGAAAERYRRALAHQHLAFHRVAATVHAGLVARPAATAVVTRLLTGPTIGRAVAGGWSIYWNELLEGAPPGSARRVAAVASAIGGGLARHSAPGRWLDGSLRLAATRR